MSIDVLNETDVVMDELELVAGGASAAGITDWCVCTDGTCDCTIGTNITNASR